VELRVTRDQAQQVRFWIVRGEEGWRGLAQRWVETFGEDN
jgi:hypothetical protein